MTRVTETVAISSVYGFLIHTPCEAMFDNPDLAGSFYGVYGYKLRCSSCDYKLTQDDCNKLNFVIGRTVYTPHQSYP